MPIEIESPEELGYEKIKYNLTESSVTDMVLGEINIDLSKLILCYGDHKGKIELRNLIAQEYGLNSNHIILTVGAAAALFIINTSILNKDSHLIVMRPNYGTNIETPKALECKISYLDLDFSDGFKLDIDKLKSMITKDTKLISLTYPHNPTGVVITESELKEVIQIVEENNCYLLFDETYRDMSFTPKIPLAATLSDKVISISSVSKAYGLPGIRMGWLICQNEKLINTFLAAKEQIYICNSVVDEEIAYIFLKDKENHFKKINEHILQNFQVLENFIDKQNYLEWVRPSGGVVCFPRIKENINVDIEKFYNILNNKYQTYVGPGHWFEMDKRFMRIGYGWSDKKQLSQGLENIKLAIENALL